MTIVLQDVMGRRGRVSEKGYIVSSDIVYADDTMIVGSSPSAVQAHLDPVIATGRSYGLELNPTTTILLRVRGETRIRHSWA